MASSSSSSALSHQYKSQTAMAHYDAPQDSDSRRYKSMMQNIEVPAFLKQQQLQQRRRSSKSRKIQRSSSTASNKSEAKVVPSSKRRGSSKVTPIMLERAERRRSSSKGKQQQQQQQPRRSSRRTSSVNNFAPTVVWDTKNRSSRERTAVSPYKIFIPGITGKARCLQRDEGDEEILDDDISTVINNFFIPGINGTPLCLKDRKKALCKRRNSSHQR